MAQPQVNIHDLNKQVMFLRQSMTKLSQKLPDDRNVDAALVIIKNERQQSIYKRDKPWLAENKSFSVSDELCVGCRNPTPHHKLIVKNRGEDVAMCPYLLIISLMRLNILRKTPIEFDPDKIIAAAKNGKKKKETM